MKLKAALITAAVLFAVPANAGWFDAIKGNDTGGIVPWAPNLSETLAVSPPRPEAIVHIALRQHGVDQPVTGSQQQDK